MQDHQNIFNWFFSRFKGMVEAAFVSRPTHFPFAANLKANLAGSVLNLTNLNQTDLDIIVVLNSVPISYIAASHKLVQTGNKSELTEAMLVVAVERFAEAVQTFLLSQNEPLLTHSEHLKSVVSLSRILTAMILMVL